MFFSYFASLHWGQNNINNSKKKSCVVKKEVGMSDEKERHINYNTQKNESKKFNSKIFYVYICALQQQQIITCKTFL